MLTGGVMLQFAAPPPPYEFSPVHMAFLCDDAQFDAAVALLTDRGLAPVHGTFFDTIAVDVSGRADSGDIEIDLVELLTDVGGLAADVGKLVGVVRSQGGFWRGLKEGARVVATAARQLKERGGGRALVSICTAGGMGVVAIIER